MELTELSVCSLIQMGVIDARWFSATLESSVVELSALFCDALRHFAPTFHIILYTHDMNAIVDSSYVVNVK